MRNPKVSTTIISFNQRQYLQESIESALAQKYDNHEVVIRDDASTDGSQEIIERYAARYPRLVKALFATRNGGLVANRDACQRATTGDYIAWLDADDIAHPDRLSEQVAFLEQQRDCTVVYFNLNIARGDCVTADLVYGQQLPPLTGGHRTLLLQENFIISSAVMFRAAALPDRGYHQPHGLTHSDWHFVVRLAHAGRIGYLDKVLGTYRRHAETATANAALVDSGVRKRREKALLSMQKQFKEDASLLRYCIARFYASQLAGAVKQRRTGVFLHAAYRLALSPAHAAAAIAHRRSGRNLLRGFEP